jgi:crotonobetainyl-CoA:carnitine CoA-transferase CaiB-like acyl-CoA transferase
LNKALLQGVRVLDLSRVLAGPWAGQILADLGADVVKVERTGVGDDTRRWGPPYFRNETTGVEEAAFFIGCNRGKRSIEVDFTTREGQDLVRALAAKADVVIENFKVGGLAKYGLDHESLRREFPSLIYCSITGFGQDGPYAERAGYDFVMQGLGGLMSVTGEPDSVPGGGPMKVGPAVTDIMTGVYAAATICAALYERKSTGQGRFIDMALLDVQVASMANFGWNYLVTGKDTERMGNSVPSLVPYEAFRTADGHMIVAVGNDGQFARFANAIGRPDLAVDERWVFGHDRVHHRQALTDIIKPILLTRPTAEWTAIFEAAGVPGGPINKMSQVYADPQVVHRGLKMTMPHSTLGSTVGVASPIKIDGGPLDYSRGAPALGEHSEEILAEWLGPAQSSGAARSAGKT